MATQPLEQPTAAAIPAALLQRSKDDMAERFIVLGSRVEALANAAQDSSSAATAEVLQEAIRENIDRTWALLDALKETGREIVSLGSKLESLS